MLAARDGGCCFPGCDRPAAWSEVHHVIPWADGGPTDLSNMCLLSLSHESRACAVMILVWA
ncbi:HNH endonuclease signature motif containing protein, partial [uncultured Jatrophihabitans sp.]|uniref:HNH endonuclease signature motif containing protein n=1 Tax=uncultured Jatrophihabitans sp. TaxID=1610747 RepID=UPI0035CA9231